jgi:hypothetical protein
MLYKWPIYEVKPLFNATPNGTDGRETASLVFTPLSDLPSDFVTGRSYLVIPGGTVYGDSMSGTISGA